MPIFAVPIFLLLFVACNRDAHIGCAPYSIEVDASNFAECVMEARDSYKKWLDMHPAWSEITWWRCVQVKTRSRHT